MSSDLPGRNSYTVRIARPGSLLALVTSCMIAGGPVANAENEHGPALTTAEIRTTFSDARDSATVMDAVGTTAVNHWYADGTFTSEWSNRESSGKVTGRWRAFDNQRCVIIESGLPDHTDRERCSPILRRGDNYVSINADGSIHGVHTVTPIKKAQSEHPAP